MAFKIMCTHLLLLALTGNVLAKILPNDREGKSFIVSKKKAKRLKTFLKKNDPNDVLNNLEDAFNKNCTLDNVLKIKDLFGKSAKKALYYARQENLVDDVQLSSLLKLNKIKLKDYKVKSADLKRAYEISSVQQIREIFSLYENKKKEADCDSEAISALYTEVKQISETESIHIIKAAYKQELIGQKELSLILSLKDKEYLAEIKKLNAINEKREFLRKYYQFPEEDGVNYVTQKSFASKKLSRRQSLYQKYNLKQIMLLGDLVRKLDRRFEAESVAIHVNYGDETEIIPVEGMDQYHFAIKILRYELDKLSHTKAFAGIIPAYSEVVTAAYELGLVESDRINHIAELEETWNPKQSRKDKILYWLKTLGSTAVAVTMPPALGGLGVVGILMIESYVQDPKRSPNPSSSLF